MGSMGSAGDGLDSYAQGVYEHRDGAPIDISNCYSDRTSVGGSGGGSTYAHGWDRIFAKKSPKEAAATTGSVIKSGRINLRYQSCNSDPTNAVCWLARPQLRKTSRFRSKPEKASHLLTGAAFKGAYLATIHTW
jgi:hypothetical protein